MRKQRSEAGEAGPGPLHRREAGPFSAGSSLSGAPPVTLRPPRPCCLLGHPHLHPPWAAFFVENKILSLIAMTIFKQTHGCRRSIQDRNAGKIVRAQKGLLMEKKLL